MEEHKKINEQEDPALQSLSRALRLSFMLLKVIVLCLFGFFVIDSFRHINAGSVGVVYRLGKLVRGPDGKVIQYQPGSLFVWPEPLERLITVPTGAGGKEKIETEFFARPRQGDQSIPINIQEFTPGIHGYNLTGDWGILHSKWEVDYRLADVETYLTAADAPERILRSVAVNAILLEMANTTSIEALHGKDLRARILDRIRRELEDASGQSRIGLHVDNINAVLIVPPSWTRDAFVREATANSIAQKVIEDAKIEADKVLAEAESQKMIIVRSAEAYKHKIAADAEADAKFVAEFASQFKDDEEGLKAQLRQMKISTVADILKRARLYVVPSGQPTTFRLEPPIIREEKKSLYD